MKDLFGKIGDSIKNTCKELNDQAEKTVNQTKYRTDIMGLKSELKNLYQKLGEQYYNAYTLEIEDMQLAPLCNRITALTKEIEKLEEQVKEKVNEQKDSFYSYKREVRNTWNERKYEKTASKTDEDGIKMMKFCEECNVGNSIEATYCINCGKKF